MADSEREHILKNGKKFLIVDAPSDLVSRFITLIGQKAGIRLAYAHICLTDKEHHACWQLFHWGEHSDSEARLDAAIRPLLHEIQIPAYEARKMRLGVTNLPAE